MTLTSVWLPSKRRHYQVLQVLFQEWSTSSSLASCPLKPWTTLNSGIPLIATFSLVLSCGYASSFFPLPSRPSRHLCLPLLICACDHHCLGFFLFCVFPPLPHLINPCFHPVFQGSSHLLKLLEFQRTSGTGTLSKDLMIILYLKSMDFERHNHSRSWSMQMAMSGEDEMRRKWFKIQSRVSIKSEKSWKNRKKNIPFGHVRLISNEEDLEF